MSLKLVLLAGWMGLCLVAAAQTDSTNRPAKKSCSCSFSSINQLGLLRGEGGTFFQFQTINGIRYKTWFAGVGVGMDLYPTDGIHVFIDVRKELFDTRFTPFIYADGGIHIASINDNKTLGQHTKYSNGFYMDAGIGYKIGFRKRGGLLLSGGYSYKIVEESTAYISNNACGIYPCNEYVNIYTWRLNRLSMKLGWQF